MQLPQRIVEKPKDKESQGKEFYLRARQLPHHVIPDDRSDSEYLSLLGKAAESDFVPALMKLGEYALRRRALVEAYYWFTRAKQCGVKDIHYTLRNIRRNWSRAGHPNESRNVYSIFPEEFGSLGRAWLARDTGHNEKEARKFLNGYLISSNSAQRSTDASSS